MERLVRKLDQINNNLLRIGDQMYVSNIIKLALLTEPSGVDNAEEMLKEAKKLMESEL